MSLILKLETLPLTISRQVWADLWDKTSKVHKEWDIPLIRPGSRILADVAVPVLTSPEDGETGYWEVFGDRKHLSYAGRFGMYRDLTYYQRSAQAYRQNSLFPKDSGNPFVSMVFGNNYMGRPYCAFLVAVGMLVEEAMGENAVLHGQFDWDDVLNANTQLQRIFGRKFRPPHVTSKDWVESRLGAEDSVHVPCHSSEHRPGHEHFERLFRARGERQFSESVIEYARETTRLAKHLPKDRDRLLRLLAENLLMNTYAVLAETIDDSILRLDENDLRWLVAFTRQHSGCISFRERKEAFIEDAELRRALVRVGAAQSQNPEKPTSDVLR